MLAIVHQVGLPPSPRLIVEVESWTIRLAKSIVAFTMAIGAACMLTWIVSQALRHGRFHAVDVIGMIGLALVIAICFAMLIFMFVTPWEETWDVDSSLWRVSRRSFLRRRVTFISTDAVESLYVVDVGIYSLVQCSLILDGASLVDPPVHSRSRHVPQRIHHRQDYRCSLPLDSVKGRSGPSPLHGDSCGGAG